MEWSDVRVLLAALRSRNLSQAARQLGVDRSTASRRLLALEKSLGARLFVRTRDGLEPTAAALRLHGPAERMEAGAGELVQANLGAPGEGLGGVVRVATTEALAARLVSQGLLEVQDRYPELVVELLAGNKPLALPREADIAVRVSRLSGANLRVRCLARFEIGLFAARSYLRGRERPGRNALRGHDVLLPWGELASLPESRWLAGQPGVRVVLRANSMATLVAAAVAGRGLVPISTGWGSAEGLEHLFTLRHLPRRPVWLATHLAAEDRGAVRVVAKKIEELLRLPQRPEA
jgi:DNA-binding transcriptional LysR family regulator